VSFLWNSSLKLKDCIGLLKLLLGFPVYNNSSFELKDCGFGELGGVFCLCFLFVYYNYGSKL